MYTLWMFLAHTPNDVAQSVISVLQLLGLVDATGRLFNADLELNAVPLFAKVLQDIASQVYRTLGLLIVLTTYMVYRNELVFHKILHVSKRGYLFLSGFIFISLLAVTSTAVTVTQWTTESDTVKLAMNIFFYGLQVLANAPTFFTMLFYVLSLVAILKYARENRKKGHSSLFQRRQLVSVIMYCTAPNILLLPVFAINVCFLIVANIPDIECARKFNVIKVINVLSVITRICIYVRIPIITISTFLAFSPYRNFLLCLIRCKSGTTRIEVSTTTAVRNKR
ncbi:hypothetical protein L596_019663 [Steinernema carpocapsae]|uniref:G-protein coupled receptors family 1 profile domain-containing protein n=1 Tax=Steinernema carpocapsae TaxID=34508 RepID=A0A4U5MRB2_STECR|nr:hypothetical protein L596_019663 [Steinernema carpocapsae]